MVSLSMLVKLQVLLNQLKVHLGCISLRALVVYKRCCDFISIRLRNLVILDGALDPQCEGHWDILGDAHS